MAVSPFAEAAASPAAAATKGAAAPKTKKSPGWADIAWHSTAAMLGAGVVGLPYTFSNLGWAGGVVLLILSIIVSRDTYMCLVRCYEVDADDFFEVRWRRRAAKRAAAARRRSASSKDNSNGSSTSGSNGKLSRAESAGGAVSVFGGDDDEDADDVDGLEHTCDAVFLVCAATGSPLDIAEHEADYCRRRALSRRLAASNNNGKAIAGSDDALEAAVVAKTTDSCPFKDETRPRAVALFHEYSALSRWAFGRRLGTALLTPFQVLLIVGICISYTIVGSEALYSIVASARALAQTASATTAAGAAATLSPLPKAPFYIAYSALQAVFAVGLGSIAESAVVSFGGVVASVVYCGIASGLALAVCAGRNASGAPGPTHVPMDTLYNPNGHATGPNAPGGANLGAAFAIFNAIAMFLFTMGGHNIALETQAVLPVPPPSTVPVMRTGVNVAFAITAIACFWTGLTGYAAFGSTVGENILTTLSQAAVSAQSGAASSSALGALSPASLVVVRVAVIVAQFAIFAHVLAAYNVYAQTLWVSVERRVARRWRDWRSGGSAGKAGQEGALAAEPVACRSRMMSAMLLVLARAPLRLVYVVAVLAVAVAVPFFGPVVGIVGAFCITPTTFVLPYALELMRHRSYDRTDDGRTVKPRSTLPMWRVLACWVGGLCASAVGIAGTAASIYLIYAQLRAAKTH